MIHFHLYFVNLAMILSYVVIMKNAEIVSDKISRNTNFYYRRLSRIPSKLATIEYFIRLNHTNLTAQCVDDQVCKVNLQIYTTEIHRNLKQNCSDTDFGQLRNVNLYTPLRPRVTRYRYTKCELDSKDTDMLQCKGNAMIQDYKPRNYGFSFGYSCRRPVKPSLVGLSYSFTIH